jgi:pimeloyl-ACP methyl ester carboxylesterase
VRYWLSNGRPSQTGLEKDALAVLEWLRNRSPDQDLNVVLLGHSLGAGVACYAAANNPYSNVKIRGVILETPFTSVPDMFRTLYPRKWLPYYYLTPFLRSSWSIKEYLERLSRRETRPRLMIIQAENDEIVEDWMAPHIQKVATEQDITVDFVQARGALHFECITTSEFPGWVNAFVQRCLDINDTSKDSIS